MNHQPIESNLLRREFLKRSVLGGIAAASCHASGLQGATRTTPMPIIDTHQHLWNLEQFRLAWLQDAPAVLSRSFVTTDYVQATQGLQVVKAVYMEVDVVPEQQLQEAEHVLGLCQSEEHPTVGAVISGRPGSESFADYVERFRDNPFIKGVRRVLHVSAAPAGHCLTERFVASIRLLGEMGKSFDLCMRPTELEDASKLVDRCPETRFILDHCGNADPKAFLDNPPEPALHDAERWRRDIGRLAKQSNVVCKISGIIARAPQGVPHAETLAPVIDHCLDEFGPDRVVFGGDWPVCLLGASYEAWVESLKQVISHRSEQDQRKLLHDNAARIYRL